MSNCGNAFCLPAVYVPFMINEISYPRCKKRKELQKVKEERKGGEINIGGRQIPFTDLGT